MGDQTKAVLNAAMDKGIDRVKDKALKETNKKE